MTMHHEISARGSLMPAGDGSALLSDTVRFSVFYPGEFPGVVPNVLVQ